jgi:2,3-bisphosphoglycerate-independent phosphoglycerate mutase
MSAIEVTDKLVENILEKEYDVIIVNYANPDMVGHTGIISAATKALETVDKCLDRVIKALLKVDGQALICADHGNADKMLDYDTGKPFTAHTSNPVPFILVNCDLSSGLKQGGRLSDLAPTLLDMMGIEIPKEMTGKSLLVK